MTPCSTCVGLGGYMHVKSYMALRHNMFFKDSQVERILLEIHKVSLPLEMHVRLCMSTPLTVLVRYLSYMIDKVLHDKKTKRQ